MGSGVARLLLVKNREWRRYCALSMIVVMWTLPLRAQLAATPNLSSSTMIITGVTCVTPAGSNAFLVSSWSWGEYYNGTKVALQNLSVAKSLDLCSEKIAEFAATGQHITTATLKQFDKDNT